MTHLQPFCRHGAVSQGLIRMPCRCLLLGILIAVMGIAKEVEVPALGGPSLDGLADIPLVAEDAAGAIVWGAGEEGDGWPVIATQADAFVVTSAIGPVRVSRSGARRQAAATVLVGLLAGADRAGLVGTDNAPLVYDHSFLTGFRLTASQAIVTAAGVALHQPLAKEDRQGEVEAVTRAANALVEQVAASAHDTVVQRTLADLLGRLDGHDGDQEFDEIPPSYARRMVRHGFLEGLFDADAADSLQRAVATASQLRPRVAYSGDGVDIKLLANAFDEQVWLHRTPEMVRIAVRPHQPEYGWHVQEALAESWLIVSWDASVDPLADPGLEQVREAQLTHAETVLARWDRESGFDSDSDLWRTVIPERPDGNSELVQGYLPPHIVIADPQGDILAIAVESGLLPTVHEYDAAAAQRFLDQAATVLPDAAHLDLIGQYILQYVYDSPEPTMATLPGVRSGGGDIHQTAEQTLLTSAGGISRGDCDDLSEVYHEILSRQGKLPHVMSLPGHATCGWAEQGPDGRWHTFVLQTGRALEFVAEKLPDSLVLAYQHFDESGTVDPNGLGLLLRFSGENRRSSWRLSWRIYGDPDYAEAMIDVQRDWHFQTYQHAIVKMQEMIAAGDHDNANYRELAGLYSFTGQHALAALYLEHALDLTPEDDSRLYMSQELFGHWAEAGDVERAGAVMKRILDELLPEQLPQLGSSVVPFGMRLIGTMIYNRIDDDIGRVSGDFVADTIAEQGDRVIRWLDSQYDATRWQTASFIRQLRRWLRWHARLSVDLLASLGPEAVLADPELRTMVRLGQRYLQYIAPYDADSSADGLDTYATLGAYYRATIGEEALLAAVEASPYPTDVETPRRDLLYGRLRQAEDMAWIKLSVPFWWSRVEDLYQRDPEAPDRALVLRLLRGAEAAYDHCREHEIVSPSIHHQGRLAHMVLALLERDEASLRQHLALVAEMDDKRLRDDSAQWLGDAARSLDLDWYRQVIACWREEVDYKAKYYWIAWRAMLNHAPQHALIAAKVAAERFADDPVFVQELSFMRILADPAGRARLEAEAKALLEQVSLPAE